MCHYHITMQRDVTLFVNTNNYTVSQACHMYSGFQGSGPRLGPLIGCGAGGGSWCYLSILTKIECKCNFTKNTKKMLHVFCC